MRFFSILSFSLISCCSLIAQKHDYNWVMGAATIVDTFPRFEIISMQFGQPDITFDTLPMHGRYRFNSCSGTYSDAEGVLRYYSNGKAIYDTTGHIMLNGDSLNYSWLWDKYSQSYIASNALVPLPDPKSPATSSYIIHATIDTGDFLAGLLLVYDPILYSKIDLTANNGKGAVIEKNIEITSANFENLTVVQHGNGRDWWIIGAEFYAHKFHIALLAEDGVSLHSVVELPYPYGDTIRTFGFLTFSQDGRYLARINTSIGLWIYEFDRCTGTFVDHRFLPFEEPIVEPGNGTIGDLEFSPSGQYLYILNNAPCYQVDLWAEPLKLIELPLLGEPKPYCNTSRGIAQLAPDGKIYVAPTGSGLCLHVVEYPDLPAPDCQFVINAFDLPVFNHNGLVHYPNYRLGPLVGSDCDTISTSIVTPINEVPHIRVWPNPVRGLLGVEITMPDYRNAALYLRLFDAMGHEVHVHRFAPYSYIYQMDTSHLPGGMYTLQLQDGSRVVAVEQVVVME